MLVLITNVPDMSAADLVARYKDLADIERTLRVTKSVLALAPMHHRLPDRIRAHTFICFLALVIERVMRFRLRKAGADLSPEKVLLQLKGIQTHRVKLVTGKELTGITTVTPQQRSLFEAIGVEVVDEEAGRSRRAVALSGNGALKRSEL